MPGPYYTPQPVNSRSAAAPRVRAQSPQFGNATAALNQQPRKNIFDTIRSVLELRRQNERQAMEDELVKDKFALEKLNVLSAIKSKQAELQQEQLELQQERKEAKRKNMIDYAKAGIDPTGDIISQIKDKTKLEREETQADIAATKAKSELLKGFQSKELDLNPDDYEMVPKTVTVDGVPTTIQEPKLKDPIDSKTISMISEIRDTFQATFDNVSRMKVSDEIQKYMNPLNPLAMQGSIPNLILRLKSADNEDVQEFAKFKAQTSQQFQKFRKKITGAQAPFKELSYLEPLVPQPQDPPETYTAKATALMTQLAKEEVQRILANKQANKRTSKFEDQSIASQLGIDFEQATDVFAGPIDLETSVKERVEGLIDIGADEVDAVLQEFK